MSQQNVEAVKHLFDAVKRRDQGGVLNAYHPEVVIHEAPSLPYGGDYHGLEGARQHGLGYVQTWGRFQTPAEWELDPLFLDASEDYVVVLWQQKAVRAESGRRLDLPAVSVYQMRDGRVVESRMFQDTAAVQDFLKETK